MLILMVTAVVAAGAMVATSGDTMTVQIPAEATSAIPMLMMLMQILKTIKPLAKLTDYFPLLVVFLGIPLGVIFHMGDTLPAQLLSGAIVGFAASGAYKAGTVPSKIAENQFAATIVSVTETPAAADRANP